jgi:hypothetical protein
MTTYDIPHLTPRPPEGSPLDTPGLGRHLGHPRNFREFSASKKVDDISRHESRHDDDPKHDPKANPREKTPEPFKPQEDKPAPRPVQK